MQFLDYRQGTPLPDPPPGTDIVLEIDVQGATEIKGRFPEAVLIFVDAAQRGRAGAPAPRAG